MKKRVIIDCDPGIDDSLALMYALKSEELDVIGITVVCGNVPVDQGVENARKVCRLMQKEDVPIFKGADSPIARPLVTAQDTHGMDGLGESDIPNIPESERPYDHMKDDKLNEAAQFILDCLHKELISIIAIGPLTNIYMALYEDLEAFHNLQEFISMGGNFKSFGNCSPVAEFNYWVDPESAAGVFEKLPCKVHMVGLDVTRNIVLTPSIIQGLSSMQDPLADFIVKITRFYVDFHKKQEGIDGCVINDPLAVAYFLHRELCHGFETYTTVETQGICVGQSVVDEKNFWHKKANSIVLTHVDSRRFMKMFLDTLFGSDWNEAVVL